MATCNDSHEFPCQVSTFRIKHLEYKNLVNSKIKIMGLPANTTYKWNLKTIFDKSPLIVSGFTDTKIFTTPLKEASLATEEPIVE